jgi:hypothetical protein
VPLERERIHFTYLLPTVVLLLIAQPVVATLAATASDVLAIPLCVTLVAVCWSLDHRGRWFRVGLGVGGVALAAALAQLVSSARLLPVANGATLVVLAALCVGLGVRALFATSRITVASLLTALSVYLLLAATFGMLFTLIYVLEPTWFEGVSPRGRSAETAELMYFSLGTLTTVAYGDILPVHPISRLLCNIEAVVGQMYIAVLVALLVGGYAARRGSSSGGGALDA